MADHQRKDRHYSPSTIVPALSRTVPAKEVRTFASGASMRWQIGSATGATLFALTALGSLSATASAATNQSQPPGEVPLPPEQRPPTAGVEAPAPARPMTATDLQDKQRRLANSSGSAAGTVLRADRGTLVVSSLERPGVEETFRLPATAPVFDAGLREQADAIHPGTALRAYYRPGRAAGPPEVLAIDVLSPDEARLLRQIAEGQ